ncbi:MAG TPA: hypothetical protein VIK26_05305 [Clostridium sp.]
MDNVKVSINLNCTLDLENKVEKWTGKISRIEDYENDCEIKIESRSGITVLVSKAASGNFACIPDFNARCHLASLICNFMNF